MTNQQRLSGYMNQHGRRTFRWATIHQGDGDCELSRPELQGHAAFASGVHGHAYPVTARQRRRLMKHASADDREMNLVGPWPA